LISIFIILWLPGFFCGWPDGLELSLSGNLRDALPMLPRTTSSARSKRFCCRRTRAISASYVLWQCALL